MATRFNFFSIGGGEATTSFFPKILVEHICYYFVIMFFLKVLDLFNRNKVVKSFFLNY